MMVSLYRSGFSSRYETVASLIEPGSTVVEPCMGDGYLYLKHLRPMGVRYVGLDINERFVRYARRRQVDAHVHDVRRDTVPIGDFIVLQGSLHQFMRDPFAIIHRLQLSARKKLIISEPVRNLVVSGNRLVASVARALIDPDVDHGARFSQQTFVDLCRQAPGFETTVSTPSGRDMVAVFAGTAEFKIAS